VTSYATQALVSNGLPILVLVSSCLFFRSFVIHSLETRLKIKQAHALFPCNPSLHPYFVLLPCILTLHSHSAPVLWALLCTCTLHPCPTFLPAPLPCTLTLQSWPPCSMPWGWPPKLYALGLGPHAELAYRKFEIPKFAKKNI
jgi:hypothetical protein